LWCRPEQPGAYVTLGVPLGKAGRYRVTVVYSKSFDYAKVQAYVNDRAVGDVTDTYSAKFAPDYAVELGTFDFEAGQVPMKFEVVGRNDDSPGYFFGIDCIVVEPVP
jgi:hypothetical protein